MELEVVLEPHQTEQEGQQIADGLMAQLGIAADALCVGAYLDMLAAAGVQTPPA